MLSRSVHRSDKGPPGPAHLTHSEDFFRGGSDVGPDLQVRTTLFVVSTSSCTSSISRAFAFLCMSSNGFAKACASSKEADPFAMML